MPSALASTSLFKLNRCRSGDRTMGATLPSPCAAYCPAHYDSLASISPFCLQTRRSSGCRSRRASLRRSWRGCRHAWPTKSLWTRRPQRWWRRCRARRRTWASSWPRCERRLTSSAPWRELGRIHCSLALPSPLCLRHYSRHCDTAVVTSLDHCFLARLGNVAGCKGCGMK